ncbi:MAG: hypothetical protein HOI96_10995 [Rhodospirillaceae bacterium]|nr:hypothetical protein [Rhodospirillaceae bacterium]
MITLRKLSYNLNNIVCSECFLVCSSACKLQFATVT